MDLAVSTQASPKMQERLAGIKREFDTCAAQNEVL